MAILRRVNLPQFFTLTINDYLSMHMTKLIRFFLNPLKNCDKA